MGLHVGKVYRWVTFRHQSEWALWRRMSFVPPMLTINTDRAQLAQWRKDRG